MARFWRKGIALLLLILFIMFSFNFPVQACGQKNKSFEGKISIGGYSLYVHSEGKGKPTVLFETGYGDASSVWDPIQEIISIRLRAVSYDRGGLGKSDRSPNPRTSLYMVKEWHTLLQKANIKGPYILVGHSMGGLNVRLFASMYPKETAGIVLVDPSHEDMDTRLISSMPPDMQELFKSQFTTEGTYEDFLISSEQVRATRKYLKNIPLTVISATNHGMGEEYDKIWMELQKDIVSLSKYGKHIVVDGSGHYIQNEKPLVVIKAIFDMMYNKNKCCK